MMLLIMPLIFCWQGFQLSASWIDEEGEEERKIEKNYWNFSTSPVSALSTWRQ
ncbi:MAG: hypothetical protein ACEY3J_04810 [Arsenophonus sp.]